MNNYIAVGLAILTVIINGLIGLFFPPNGILLTPIILIITTLLVVVGTKNIKVIPMSLLTYLFVALNDISVKFYAGGAHDTEGLGWIHSFLFIGLFPTIGILLLGISDRKNEKFTSKITAIGLFFALIVIHLLLFHSLGLEEY